MSRVLRRNGRIVKRDGRRAREGCQTPCCNADLYLRATRCTYAGPPGCPPPTDLPPPIFVRQSAVCINGLTPIAGRTIARPGGCYVVGATPTYYLGTPIIGSLPIPVGAQVEQNTLQFFCQAGCSSCQAPGGYAELLPCGGGSFVPRIFVCAAAIVEGGATTVSVSACGQGICGRRGSALFQSLPPGATFLQNPDMVYSSCCACSVNSYCGRRILNDCNGQPLDCGCCGRQECGGIAGQRFNNGGVFTRTRRCTFTYSHNGAVNFYTSTYTSPAIIDGQSSLGNGNVSGFVDGQAFNQSYVDPGCICGASTSRFGFIPICGSNPPTPPTGEVFHGGATSSNVVRTCQQGCFGGITTASGSIFFQGEEIGVFSDCVAEWSISGTVLAPECEGGLGLLDGGGAVRQPCSGCGNSGPALEAFR